MDELPPDDDLDLPPPSGLYPTDDEDDLPPPPGSDSD
jgi:hypothetical protein